MRVHFTDDGWQDFVSRGIDQETKDRIIELTEVIRRTPFVGIGKPEPLKKPLQGCWSRRINKVDRLVYRVEGAGDSQCVIVIGCRDHY